MLAGVDWRARGLFPKLTASGLSGLFQSDGVLDGFVDILARVRGGIAIPFCDTH